MLRATYLEKGGEIHPLEMLDAEGSDISFGKSFKIK